MSDETISLITRGQEVCILTIVTIIQQLYRAEKYGEARAVFESILKDRAKDRYVNEFKVELFTNLIASMVMSGDYDAAVSQGEEFAKSNYEIAYNVGCARIGMSAYKEAIDLLKAAANMCRDTMKSKNATKEELDEEITPILVQELVANMLHGNDISERLKTQQEESKNDVVASVVLTTNAVHVKRDADLPDARKKFRSIFHLPESFQSFERMTSTQQASVLSARAFVLMSMNKLDEAKDVLSRIRLSSPYHRAPLVIASNDSWYNMNVGSPYAVATVCEAVVQSKCNSNVDLGISLCDQFLIERAKHTDDVQSVMDIVYVGLALVRLHVMKGQPIQAFDVVMTISRITPCITVLYTGCVLCLHAFPTISDRATALSRMFDAVESSCTRTTIPGPVGMHQARICQMFMGVWLAHAGDHTKALSLFTSAIRLYRNLRDLVEQGAQVPDWMARHYDSQDYFGLKYAVISAKSVGDTAYSEYDGVLKDTATHAQPGWLKLYIQFEQLATPSAAMEVSVQNVKPRKRNRKNKKRKVKLPKTYDPNVVPDPERWLPKRDRSSYKKTQKKKDAHLRGSQGMVSAATAASLAVSSSSAPSAAGDKSPAKDKAPPVGIEKHARRRKK